MERDASFITGDFEGILILIAILSYLFIISKSTSVLRFMIKSPFCCRNKGIHFESNTQRSTFSA